MKKKTTAESPLDGTNGQLMVMAAHRYSLGRHSYIVSSCIEWLRAWWPEFDDNTRYTIVRDTIDALQDDIERTSALARGCTYIGRDVWMVFAEWAFAQMDEASKKRCVDVAGARCKPWPLKNKT